MRSRKGFTLIELMIVVAILALLSAIAIPLYQGYIVDARKTEAKTNLMAIRLLEEQYYSDNGVYLAGEYSVDAETLKTGLIGFEPKPAADLHYSYIVALGEGAPPSYTATATLKYDAEKFFSITDDNVRLNDHDRSW